MISVENVKFVDIPLGLLLFLKSADDDAGRPKPEVVKGGIMRKWLPLSVACSMLLLTVSPEVSHATQIKDKLLEKIQASRPTIARLVKEYGAVPVDHVTVQQVLNMRSGPRLLLGKLSETGADGITRYHGKSFEEVVSSLPKAIGAQYPSVESFWYFLLTGEIPTVEQAAMVEAEFKTRQQVPEYVFQVVRALPKDSSPIVMLSTGLLAMQKDSSFAAFYASGTFNKMDAWEYAYEDASDIVARLPVLAAFIYNLKYRGDKQIPIDPTLDSAGNFAHMLGQSELFKDKMRAFSIKYADRTVGNVASYATHLAGSSLADPYMAYAAGVQGIAAPRGEVIEASDVPPGFDSQYQQVLLAVSRAMGATASVMWDRALGLGVDQSRGVSLDTLSDLIYGGQ